MHCHESMERALSTERYPSWQRSCPEMNNDEAGGSLPGDEADRYRKHYRVLTRQAELECPAPDKPKEKAKRGRLKRSTARNLLERLIHYEDDVLRFMENPSVPFTNNEAENVIRMIKLQQKISGCFRSRKGADIFCRVRRYLSTCRKQSVQLRL